MPYKKKTIFYGIPIPCKGDKIQEAEETKARNIIENQLLAGSKGVRCAVFEEGYYKLIDNHDGSFAVALSQTMAAYALCGIVGGAYVESKEPILWNNLDVKSQYWLYIQFTDNLFVNEHDFRIVSSTTPKDLLTGHYLLLAHVDLREDKRLLETYPDGKIYSEDIATHVSDFTNPHGEKLVQDDLVVRQQILVKIEDDASLTGSAIVLDDAREGKASIESKKELVFKDQRGEVALTDLKNPVLKTDNQSIVGAINELFGEKVLILDIEGAGIGGVSIDVPKANEVLFVNVNALNTQLPVLNSTLGQLSFGYFGIDSSVTKKSSFKMYNDGNSSIKIRLQIIYK